MFVHEYSDKYFETYEECRDDLISEINSDDIMEHFFFSFLFFFLILFYF